MLDRCGIPAFEYSADNIVSEGNEWIIECWESARNRMDALQQKEAILVIDEVQKIKGWSEAVKKEWDHDTRKKRNLKVVLLGSSRLLLQKGLEESLAGRFEKIDMPYWSYDEMHDAFGMTRDEYIYFGGFPGLYEYIKDETRWRSFMESSIVSPFLQKDITLIEEIRNPTLMSRVFAVASAYSAKEIAINSMQTELNSGTNPTISNYLSLLDKTMMVKPLFKYRNKEEKKNNSAPKMQVYNNGFLSVNRNTILQEVRSDNTNWGQWIESAVGAHLLNMSTKLGYEVMYWREKLKYKDKQGKTREGTFEVDFVLRKGCSVVAIEVKSNRAKQLSGITEFRKLFNENNEDRLTSTLVVGNQGLTFEEFCRLDLNRLFQGKSIDSEMKEAVPTSRLDMGQKKQLELIGRINGTVWLDGDDYIIQKNKSGELVKMRSRDVDKSLEENTPEILKEMGLNKKNIIQEFAKGHTISVGKLKLYYDINTRSIEEGITYEEALFRQKCKEKEPEKNLMRKIGIKL